MSHPGPEPAPDQPGDRQAHRALPIPDYRMSLAAERTYLAYLRTGLALTAAGVAVVAALPGASASVLRRCLGMGLVLVGAAIFVAARPRWSAVTRAMERGEPLPPARVAPWVAVVLVGAAIASAVIVLIA